MNDKAFDLFERMLQPVLNQRRHSFPDHLRYMQVVAGSEGNYVRSTRFQIELEHSALEELRQRGKGVKDVMDHVLAHLPRRVRLRFLENVAQAIPALLSHERDDTFAVYSAAATSLGFGNYSTRFDATKELLTRDLTLHIELLTFSQTGASARPLDVLATPRYAGALHHWESCERLLMQTPPDVVNAAKEAFGAAEALARVVLANPKITLGDAIDLLKERGHIPPALAKGLRAIWGYASDEPGVRHSGPHPPTVTDSEAQLAIDTAAGIVEYLTTMDVPSDGAA